MRGLNESMGTNRFILLKITHFHFVGFMHGFLYRNMLRVVDSFWVFLSELIGFFFRFPTNGYLEDLDSNFDEFKEKHINYYADQGKREGENSAMAASTSKYEFLYCKGVRGFIEEPKTKNYIVHEFYMGSNDSANFNGGILDPRDSADTDYGKIEVEMEDVFEDKIEECALRFSFEKIFDFEKQIKVTNQKQPVGDYAGSLIVETTIEKPKQDIKNVIKEKAEESVENYIIEKILEKLVGDIEGNEHVAEELGEFVVSTVIDKYLEKWHQETMEHEIHGCNTSISDHEAAILGGPINDFDDEFIELELQSENLSVKGETRSEEDLSIEDKDDKETESMVSPKKFKERNLQEDEDSEFGSEHDDLIERLKMEVKIANTGGLPTISEEFESPMMMQELGPLKIDEKYDHNYHIAEIQKVYKSYSDKMRKLDILNSQTMHSISLLRLKDVPVQLSTPGKSSAPAIKSLHKELSFKQRKAEADSAIKLIRDLHKDFEIVYVGQICLSWAMLHWQFRKVKKLLECDTLGIHQYNQVAGEFQHFQVLSQRFLEDEPFQTRPRVENYVNHRCSVRHLLQVPVIKDDCSKYKEDAVSSEMLKDIIEESMLVFWEFLRADKGEANFTSKVPLQLQVSPLDTIDFDLLMDVRTDLQKKEKRLKEIQRGTKCIIKKFQRQHQKNLLDHALFIAQVELNLVSRVLNMSKISTGQLVWCHEKLQRINFSRRKIEIEPSFTLFPC